jgi:hypothetical protein
LSFSYTRFIPDLPRPCFLFPFPTEKLAAYFCSLYHRQISQLGLLWPTLNCQQPTSVLELPYFLSPDNTLLIVLKTNGYLPLDQYP